MPGTVDELNCCVSPTPTATSSFVHDSPSSREFKDFNGIRTWGSRNNNSRSSSALDRHSESSESLDNQSSCSANGGRHMQDFVGSSEYIPTRSTKTAPKVAYNPMQFVKTGPTKLVQTAQEQLKKAEQVKKVRETKKEDAEDWQSNLEGWKSSRRKRQEHVIERVTEVKRMEQEEALKASEAATKRLIGIREKRGKLSALYSVEDNDEIEFKTNEAAITALSTTDDAVAVDSSPDSSVFDADEQSLMVEKAASVTTTTPARNDLTTVAPEGHTFVQSIEDEVTLSASVLSQQETTATTSCTARTATHIDTWAATRMGRHQVAVKGQEASQTNDANNKMAVTAMSDNVDELVVKRRCVFEGAAAAMTTTTAAAVSEAVNATANRRSGEFSSTFKSRLSTFEMTEAAADRDGHFKPKLAALQKAAEPNPSAVAVADATTAQVPDRPDFKAKLAAFRQVEEKASAQIGPVAKMNKPAITAAKPVIAVSMRAAKVECAPPPPRHPHATPKTGDLAAVQPEPIYANSSVAMAGSSLSCGHERIDGRSLYSSLGHSQPRFGRAADAESYSDCTEDEGIRSLSPHGATPSPTSPTPSAMQPLPPPLPSHPPVGYSPYSFQQQHNMIQEQSPDRPPVEAMLWHDWVDLGAVVHNAAPPTEKPPPPPVSSHATDARPLVHHSTCSARSTPTTCTTSTTSTAAGHQQVALRRDDEGAGARQELRKRRSHFLGFDVNAMEDDAKALADAIPPPPDLKTLLRRSFTGDGTSQYGVAEWQAPPLPSPPAQHEDELARREREIIETLEKEEKERTVQSPSATSITSITSTIGQHNVHNSSVASDNRQGIECEMTAEIDQLAREWQTGSSVRRAATRLQQQQQQPQPQPHDHLAALSPEGEAPGQLHVDVDVDHHHQSTSRPPSVQQPRQSTSAGTTDTTGATRWTDAKLGSSSCTPQPQLQLQSPLSPPKPSRLSAAPKPKLHDGEAWMAKRKVASEGAATATRARDMKDVSRHWLIQEAEQRRIDAMQERQRNCSPSSSSSPSLQLSPPARSLHDQPTHSLPAAAGATVDAVQPPCGVSPANTNFVDAGKGLTSAGGHWMSRSSSSTSVDQMSELRLLAANHKGMDQSFRSTSSLGSSPTPRPLYVNHEEILEYADFTGAPHAAPPVWQVRSLVASGSMDQLHHHHHYRHRDGSVERPPSRPAKSQSQTLPLSSSCSAMQQFSGNAAQSQPSWRSTHPPDAQKEPIAPLPHSVITTLTQRMTQRSNSNSNNNNTNANYGDYMNLQEVTLAQQQHQQNQQQQNQQQQNQQQQNQQQQNQQSAVVSTTRPGPQVPAQRPANYRHPSVVGPSLSAPVQTTTAAASGGVHQSQQQNNNDRMLSVSGKKKCSLCQEELGRGAAMIIESLRLFYHINCFRCCVCGIALGNGTAGTDVRVRNNNLHCHDCYSNDDGLKFSKV